MKKKYWYRTEIFECVCCGRQDRNKHRVYNKIYRGTHWNPVKCLGDCA